MKTSNVQPTNIHQPDVAISTEGARSGAVVFWSGSPIPIEAMRTACDLAGIPTEYQPNDTAPALAMKEALTRYSRSQKNLMPPQAHGKSVWSVMLKQGVGADEDAATKGARSGDLTAYTEVKGWVEKGESLAAPVLHIEGATVEDEAKIRENYAHALTVVPGGKFGSYVGDYVRHACNGVCLKATAPGETGQGKGGNFYVPEANMHTWEKFATALENSGCTATLFQLPAMSGTQTAKAIGAAVNSEVEYELGQIEAALQSGKSGKKLLENREAKLVTIREKLESYAGTLGDLTAGIQARVEQVSDEINDLVVCQLSDDDEALLASYSRY